MGRKLALGLWSWPVGMDAAFDSTGYELGQTARPDDNCEVFLGIDIIYIPLRMHMICRDSAWSLEPAASLLRHRKDAVE